MKKKIVAGLDLGTTKVCAVIAEQTETGIDVLGFGVSPSEGLNRGLVANIQKTSQAIKEAVEIASNRAGLTVSELNVGVAGEHIISMENTNYVTINNPDREITEKDIERLNADVRLMRIPADRQILHIIPEEYSIDNQGGIDNPIGMCGSKLEAISHVVLASTHAIQNINKSVERAGYKVKDYVLQPIASSSSVLDENEQDLGIALIDIGGGTTDVAVFHDKRLKHTKVIGVAGNQVTNDIREYFGIVTGEAEKLKKEYGYAHIESIIKDEDIYMKGVGARGNFKLPTSLLAQIISARMRELFSLIDNDLRQTGFKKKIKAGIVLTGGGSLLKGSTELAEEVFGLPARIGLPIDLGAGLSSEIERPEFATVMGLVKAFPWMGQSEEEVKVKTKSPKKNIKFKSIIKQVQKFFDEL
ncbi:MAG: cell division protein FtsA [Melioribacteraceae bacterium]|jgi:cell division protein FtsA|nr:cell division protein FtsA [Melioribacteraceae bacterium]